MAKLYRETFTVTGSGTFPLDMLRYDACFPDTEEDSRLIQRACDRETFDPFTVTLARYTTRDHQTVTPDRWQSFGWRMLAKVPR